jgi:hypothetical protein
MKKVIVVAIAALLSGNVYAFGGDADARATAHGGKGGQGGQGGTGIGIGGSAHQGQGQLQGQLQGQGQAQKSYNTNLNSVYGSNRNSNSNRNANLNANSNRNSNTNVSGSKSGAVSGAASFNKGNSNDITIEDAENPVNSAYAPALAASAGTCLGSASGGAQGSAFGFSIGSTTKDKDCNTRKNTMMLYGLGKKAAAIKYVCNRDAEMAEALGSECPTDETVSKGSTSANHIEGNSWYNENFGS